MKPNSYINTLISRVGARQSLTFPHSSELYSCSGFLGVEKRRERSEVWGKAVQGQETRSAQSEG